MTRRVVVDATHLDEGQLRRMLDLVGPAAETSLLKSLIGDLQAARAALVAAIGRQDGPALCNQTHMLAALAGTFGAPALAIASYALAHGAYAGVATSDGARVLALTDGLLATLTSRMQAGTP